MKSTDIVLVSVPTKTLAEYRCYDPFKFSPRGWAQVCTFLPDTNQEEWRTLPEWENNPIRREEIADKIAARQFRDMEGGQTRNEHLERIAHLVACRRETVSMGFREKVGPNSWNPPYVNPCFWPLGLAAAVTFSLRQLTSGPRMSLADYFMCDSS
jgi:hypothetical protein